MSKKESELLWTAKTDLSSRIQDPLGLYVLKFLERYFLAGITTQTRRLRYYSFLTWAWMNISDKNIEYQKILNIEKVATLASAYHHLNDRSAPNGIRNRRSARDFIRKRSSLSINRFVEFGRNNRDGYGNYYYKGPLATLRVCARLGDEIVTSEVGKQIANAYETSIGINIHLLFNDKLMKNDLSKLESACFCGSKVTSSERKLWRNVFFGFTKSANHFDLKFDQEEYSVFKNGELQFPDVSIQGTVDIQDYLKAMEMPDDFLKDSLQESVKKVMARRASLFLILRIIQKAKPATNPPEVLDQTIRDCVYFNQIEEKGTVRPITFGPLTQCNRLWESYVHNLYYINFFEFTFEILLGKMKAHPMGISVEEIINTFSMDKIIKELQNFGLSVKDEKQNINELEESLRLKLNQKKTTLKAALNEKQVFLNIIESEETEIQIANLICLFLLLKYRFDDFSQSQKAACEFKEGLLYSTRPTAVYQSFGNISLIDFLRNILDLTCNRHRLVSALKYDLNGTHSWLFTEEDGMCFYYGTDYWVRSFREAKWINVIELLMDMGLVTISDSKYCLSEVGEKWLARIF